MPKNDNSKNDKPESNNESDNNLLISIDKVIPSHLFIIPIFDNPIFPGIMTPILISEPRLIDAINNLEKSMDFVGLLLVKDETSKEITPEHLYTVGTVVKIAKKINLPNGGVNILVNSLKRFRVKKFTSKDPFRLMAFVEYPEASKEMETKEEIKAYTRSILSQLRLLSENNPLLLEQLKLTLANVDEPSNIGDFAITAIKLKRTEYQEILEELDVKKRLNKVLRYLDKEVKLLELQINIQKQINTVIDKKQREFFLKEQLKAIKQELGIDESPQNVELKSIQKRIRKLKFNDEIKEALNKEIEKFKAIDPHSAEYTITKNYIDTILALPWGIYTKDYNNLKQAQNILNQDHFGLDDVKDRILEFLAVRKLKGDTVGGSIICLLGPPGVGKTSLGKSIARALKRKFYRFSLGGMRDEAEIKGHRRTYVGAMPGKILQGLKYVKSSNPVFMLDEIDKLSYSFQADPASALLEVLDPEQNKEFLDYYIDLPYDLSSILFITTANTIDTIPKPLIDRMEIIRLSGYIEEEKYEIAKRYLLPRQLEKHGLNKNQVKLTKSAYTYIINSYARDAGVRNLDRALEKICRKIASLIAREKQYDKQISKALVKEYLGNALYSEEVFFKNKTVGVATGLAWTPSGGSVIFVETIKTQKENSKPFTLTGQLGNVMTESASIAYSHVSKIITNYGINKDFFKNSSIHIHVPEGATPKDGPSAGITIASSILSLVFNKPTKPKVGMTGELTLTGYVLPIGGLKEKIIAAKRNKLKEVICPKDNIKDLQQISSSVKEDLHFHLVKTLDEVIKLIFD